MVIQFTLQTTQAKNLFKLEPSHPRFTNICVNCVNPNVGLKQGCVMSPWMFDVYMDGVVREVNLRVLWKWLELLSVNGGRFEINQLLFADNTSLYNG